MSRVFYTKCVNCKAIFDSKTMVTLKTDQYPLGGPHCPSCASKLARSPIIH